MYLNSLERRGGLNSKADATRPANARQEYRRQIHAIHAAEKSLSSRKSHLLHPIRSNKTGRVGHAPKPRNFSKQKWEGTDQGSRWKKVRPIDRHRVQTGGGRLGTPFEPSATSRWAHPLVWKWPDLILFSIRLGLDRIS